MATHQAAPRLAGDEPEVAAFATLGLPTVDSTTLRFLTVPAGPFGVEVRGIDWAPPDADTVRLLTVALRRHLLLVLRGHDAPSEDQLDTFLRGFGRLVLDTEDGRAHYAGHLDHTGPASEMAQASTSYMTRSADNTGSTYYQPGADGMAELVWHSDQSHRPMLKVLSVLEAQEVDDGAVPTGFRDMYTAYETLPDHLRSALQHKQVVYFNPRLPPPEQLWRLADATHPVFTPHPHTGRRALFVNDFSERIVGMNRHESDAMLAELRSHIDAHAPVYTHRWHTGDIVMWDNVGLQHRRDAVPANQRRCLRQHGGLAE